MLYGIAPDSQELQGGAEIHEDMEDGMHPLSPFSQAVEDGTDGVGDAAGQQKAESLQCQGFDHLRTREPVKPKVEKALLLFLQVTMAVVLGNK